MAYFYEINFYGMNHPRDWTFYLEAETELQPEEVVDKLEGWVGYDGLEKHHLENVVDINLIPEQDYINLSGVEPLPKKLKSFVLTATLEVTAANEEEAKQYYMDDLNELYKTGTADIKVVTTSDEY